MFPTLGLLLSVRCPDISVGGAGCLRSPCLFSHTLRADVPATATASSIKRDIANSVDRDDDADDVRAPKRHRSLFTNGQPASPTLSSSAVNSVSPFRTSVGAAASSSSSGPLVSRTAAASSSTRRLGPLKSGSDAYVKSLLQARERQSAHGAPSTSKKAFAATVNGTSHTKSVPLASSSKGKGREVAGNPLANTHSSQVVTSAEPPRVAATAIKTYVPLMTRNGMLKSIHKEYLQLYGGLQPRVRALNLASQHALAEEAAVYTKNNQHSYRNAGISVIARLKRRDPVLTISDAGTLAEVDSRALATTAASNTADVVANLQKLTLTRQQMISHGFIVDMPSDVGSSQRTCEGETKTCARCKNSYIVRSHLTSTERQSCNYHWGRITAPGELVIARLLRSDTDSRFS